MMAHHKTGDEDKPRYFCIGKRTAGKPMDAIDQYNFCVYTPYKGVVQFQIWEGDMEIWIALFSVARRLIIKDKHDKDKKIKIPAMALAEGWLECMLRVFTKNVNYYRGEKKQKTG